MFSRNDNSWQNGTRALRMPAIIPLDGDYVELSASRRLLMMLLLAFAVAAGVIGRQFTVIRVRV